jgi:hypothetical protein
VRVIRGLKVISNLAILVDSLKYSSIITYKVSSYYIFSYINLFKNLFLTRIIFITFLLSYFKTLYNLVAFIIIL